MSLPELINHPNLTLEIALIQAEEIRHADGRGSWRRHGQSIQDQRLLGVLETVTFVRKEDFRRFLPDPLEQPFTNQSLAQRIGLDIHATRQMTYCLRKMGLIQQVGKNRNEFLFEISQ